MTRKILQFLFCLAGAQAQYNVRGPDGLAVDINVNVPRTTPKVAWEYRPGDRDFSGLALSNGVVITGNPTSNSGIHAVDAATGKRLWGIPGSSRSSPAVDARNVYVVNESLDGKVRLSANELRTGRQVWAVENPAFKVGANAPLVAAGKVYLLNRAGTAQAYDVATGKLVWEQPYDWDTGQCPTSAAYAEGIVYYGGGEIGNSKNWGRHLWAVDAATGKVIRKFKANPYNNDPGGECVSAPAIAAGMVFITAVNHVYALEAKTGKVVWKREVLDGERVDVLAAPVIANGTVFANTAHALLGWDLWTGAENTRLPGDFKTGSGESRLSVGGGLVFFLASTAPEHGQRRRLHAYDPKTRKILWTHYVNRQSDSLNWDSREVLVTNGALYYTNYRFLARIQ